MKRNQERHQDHRKAGSGRLMWVRADEPQPEDSHPRTASMTRCSIIGAVDGQLFRLGNLDIDLDIIEDVRLSMVFKRPGVVLGAGL